MMRENVLFLWMAAACVVPCAADTSVTAGHVVQFVVYAETQTDVSKVFPGAYVDYTWNNVFVVSVWVENPDTAIPLIKKTVDANPILKMIIPPYSMSAATQKWLRYNMVWVGMLTLLFMSGCACGMAVMNACSAYKSATRYAPSSHKCRTRY
jgi:hypothetical protein